GQRTASEQRSLVADNRATLRVETVPVQADIEAVVFRIAVVQFRKYFPIVTKTRTHSETRIDRLQSVRHLLQIRRIFRVSDIAPARDGERRIRRGQVCRVYTKSIFRVDTREGRVDYRNGIFLPLLFVVHKKPGAMRHDWASDVAAELLQNICRLGNSICLIHGIVGAGARVAVVVEGTAVELIDARAAYRVHEARSRSAVFGAEWRDRHLKFLDCAFSKDVGDALAT